MINLALLLKKKNAQDCDIPEITDLLQYWLMLEIFGGKLLKADYIKNLESTDGVLSSNLSIDCMTV